MRQKKGSDKPGRATGRKTRKANRDKLSKAVSWAHIVTPGILLLTLGAAIWGAITAYHEFQAAYNDYQARTRPYLVIQDLQFYEASSDSMYLLVDVDPTPVI
ncbi:MAG: hypothetical protein MUP49_05230 [Dehalococcoidia bacterium]|nr:hypothetical protein [Dehalococcoidia bacterium]